MGLVAKQQNIKKEDYTLLKHEYEYLFGLLKESTFKGTDIEVIYKIAYKLQKQYTEKYQKQ